MGPQDDEPVCPCAMQGVIKWRGQWLQLRTVEAPKSLQDLVAERQKLKDLIRMRDPNRLP